MDRRQPIVTNYPYVCVRDTGAGKDLVQETALVLLRLFGEYGGEIPIVGWAFGVTKFRVLGLRRDEVRRFVTFDSEPFEQFTAEWSQPVPSPEGNGKATLRRNLGLESFQRASLWFRKA